MAEEVAGEVAAATPPTKPLLLIAALVAYAFMVPLEGFDVVLAAPVAALGAALVGIPAVKLALRLDLRAPWWAVLIGALAGWVCLALTVLIVWLLSGKAEPQAFHDFLLGYPAYITLPIAAITGLVYWAIYVRRRR